ncbi:hypothetical protein SESBI_10689 [Sesbania bispinosa]|nr:hypothetical protein SESBI_10689 [Sesbania bispinosa]
MERELRHTMKPWIEVAPSLLEFPWKPSNTPKLETILEDEGEETGGGEDGLTNFLLFSTFTLTGHAPCKMNKA